jgi:hypothetical protein
MNKSTFGELLFEEYLMSQKIVFEREPLLPGVPQLIDFVVDHPTHGKILLEVKDIENAPPPRGPSVVNFYTPIRKHIAKGTSKFKETSGYVGALVLVAPPNSFVQLDEPHIVLGAMYGDFGYRIPFDPDPGRRRGNPDPISAEFIPGKGKMVHKTGFRNTRIAALITVHKYSIWNLAMSSYLKTDDGRPRNERVGDLLRGEIELPVDPEASETGVTVWENAVGARKLPQDIFRGQMDAWWESSEGEQRITFVGERRKALRVDDHDESLS